MQLLLTVVDVVGWLAFIYLGGAGVYELLGGRRVRASALLAGAITWIVVTFLVLWLARAGGIVLVLVLAYLAATAWLVRKVHQSLGFPDMDIG